MRAAVVSGLGPNGLLAALKLHAAGFQVTAVEQRTAYIRTIHLSLRRAWLDDVRALDGALFERLAAITSPIEAFEHLRSDRRNPAPAPGPAPLAPTRIVERLQRSPVVHVRLDELEQLLLEHLRQQPGVHVITGAELMLEGEGAFSARCAGAVVERPELIVVAEGGKSPTARRLGLHMRKVSSPRFYLSVHVDYALGPISRRLDTVDAHGAEVSFWASGHRERARGTWLVLEVPAAPHAGRARHSIDTDYYTRGAAELLGLPRAPAPNMAGFCGTFRFEQQLLPTPVAGTNVVFFGDAAGMGHHALGTGLELGACDLSALDALIASPGALEPYARRVVRSRIDMLAYGMNEYYPGLVGDPTPWLDEALQDPLTDVPAFIASRVADLT